MSFSGAGPQIRPSQKRYTTINAADSTAITNVGTTTRFDKYAAIPANTLRVGDIIDVEATGYYSVDAAGNVNNTWRAHIGAAGAGAQFAARQDALVGGSSGEPFYWKIRAVVRAVGSSGSIRLGAVLLATVPGGVSVVAAAGLPSGTTIAVNTTLDRVIEFSVAPASARAGDTFALANVQLTVTRPVAVV